MFRTAMTWIVGDKGSPAAKDKGDLKEKVKQMVADGDRQPPANPSSKSLVTTGPCGSGHRPTAPRGRQSKPSLVLEAASRPLRSVLPLCYRR